MRKNLNKLATLALSGMMVMSMAMPAMAATTIPFYKVLHTDGNTYAPRTTFTFSVKKNANQKITISNIEYNNLAATMSDQDVKNAVKIPNADFEPSEQEGLGTEDTGTGVGGKINKGAHFTRKLDISVDKTKFTEKGHYFFTFTENIPDEADKYEGIKYSTTEYTLVVTKVEPTTNNPDGLILAVQKSDKLADKDCKISTINNNYGKHFPPKDDPRDPEEPGDNPKKEDDTTHDVVIKKKVVNPFTQNNGSFKFKVKVTSQNSSNEWFKTATVNGTTEEIVAPIKPGQDREFVVTNDKGIHIWGLTEHDLIEVTEEDGETYTMTVAAVKDKESYITLNPIAQTSPVNPYYTNLNVLKDDAAVDITNTKKGVTPTGIVMNVAPYAMMLAVAGGLGVVFVNRKKEEE